MVRGRMVRVFVAIAALSLALVGIGSSAGIPVPGAVSAADASVQEGTPTAAPVLNIPDRNTVPDGGRPQAEIPKDEATTIWDLPAGTLITNPVSGREEIIDPGVAGQAVLFGDSQAGGAKGVRPADTWVERGLAARGYKVRFVGAGGTGFVASTVKDANYPDAVTSGRLTLPYGKPALVVFQGGGNDAAQGATDAQITANAERLLRELKASYPTSEFLIIGTLGRGGAASGDRRGQVDSVLAGFAKGNGIQFISPRDWLTRYGVGNKMADGVHLTAAGHEELSKALASELKSLGLQAPALTG